MNGAATLLVLGGARSGKSAFAQRQVEGSGLTPVFVATAQSYDQEMSIRIANHVAARDARWWTVEAPFDLEAALTAEARPDRMLLVDCLTLWLSNLMLRGDDIDAAGAALVARACRMNGPAVFVSNEVGCGIVPENALARRFRDAQGRLNQALANACRDVVFVTAGMSLVLKPNPAISFTFRP